MYIRVAPSTSVISTARFSQKNGPLFIYKITFHEAEHSKGLRFESPMCFILSTAPSMGINERVLSLSILIMDQDTEKYS